jgi:uncharacterized membrane protein YkvA (DUF1232 family)
MMNNPQNSDIFNPAFWRRTWAEVQLAWKLLRDPRVPLYLKGIPLLAVLYLLSPFDLIPGFIPIAGQLDDLAIILLGVKFFVRLAPPAIVQEYERAAGGPTP